jgi:hypothetical protein
MQQINADARCLCDSVLEGFPAQERHVPVFGPDCLWRGIARYPSSQNIFFAGAPKRRRLMWHRCILRRRFMFPADLKQLKKGYVAQFHFTWRVYRRTARRQLWVSATATRLQRVAPAVPDRHSKNTSICERPTKNLFWRYTISNYWRAGRSTETGQIFRGLRVDSVFGGLAWRAAWSNF